MKVTDVIETFYFLKNFLISVNATISFFDNSHFYWLSRFNRKTFHFPQVFPLICDRSVWHNGKYPRSPAALLPFKDQVPDQMTVKWSTLARFLTQNSQSCLCLSLLPSPKVSRKVICSLEEEVDGMKFWKLGHFHNHIKPTKALCKLLYKLKNHLKLNCVSFGLLTVSS